nr:secretion protein HlyD [Selenomonas massiliensis]
MFCPIEEANRTHSQSYVEDLLTKSGQKRYAKMARLNLGIADKMKSVRLT